MRWLLWFLASGVLLLQGWFLADSADGAARVHEQARSIVALDDDAASEMALSVCARIYPFSPGAFAARRGLTELPGALGRREQSLAGVPLRDALILDQRPWLGPAGVMALALLLLLHGLLAPRSRVRVPSLLVLLMALGASALSQGWIGLPAPAQDEGWSALVVGQTEALAFAAFPWATLTSLGAAWALGLLPRRAAR